jgi:endoglucanase
MFEYFPLLAMAARIYSSYDAALAQSYLAAAQKAWNYLQTQPTMQVDWYMGNDTGSGKYLASECNTEPALKTDIV